MISSAGDCGLYSSPNDCALCIILDIHSHMMCNSQGIARVHVLCLSLWDSSARHVYLQVIATDSARVGGDVPAPHSNSVPLLQLEHLGGL